MKFTQYEPQIVAEAFEEISMEGWGTSAFPFLTYDKSEKNIKRLMDDKKIRKYLKQQATEIFNKAKKDPEYANCKIEEDDGNTHFYETKNKKNFFTEWLNDSKNHMFWFAIDNKHFLVYGDTDHIEKVEYSFISTNKETGRTKRILARVPAPTSKDLIEMGYREED